MAVTKQQHLDRTRAPKRMLALDGGGVRGILSLEYLGVVERILRERSGNDALLLCDYFDLIAGTSTGAIIAATLACGMPVDAVKRLYRQLGTSVFNSRFWRRGLLVPKFSSDAIRQALDANLGSDTSLDSDRVRTGLMIMTKRLDTGSPWPLHNNPDAPYAREDGALLLPQIVRASTAAPTYFEPERIAISSRQGTVVDGAFVDGGVSPFNDPALQLLMVAALHGHGFRWRVGASNLLLISVGTGRYTPALGAEELLRMVSAEQGVRALQSLMDDCARVNQTLLQWLTTCLTPWAIDRAVGDMQLDSQAGPRLATYARYNALLDAKWLKAELDMELAPADVAEIGAMDDPGNIDKLVEIGRLAAAKQVKPEHFPPGFDI